jgi:hypothetical protein
LIAELEVENGSERWLRWGAAGEESGQKHPNLEQRRMFMNIGKSYIWMWRDITERVENLIGKMGWWVKKEVVGVEMGGVIWEGNF